MERIIKLDELDTVNTLLSNISDNQILSRFINGSSKRIRSISAVLYFKSCGKDFSPEMFNVLCIGEVLHNASLLHDDVIDDADTRRGNISANREYSPKTAVILGDLLFSLAAEKFIEIKNWEIFDIFRECCTKMCQAELLQFSLRGEKTDIEQYLNICENKTGALFEAIFKSCAILSGEDCSRAENFAKNFGIMFQLKNDLEKTSAELDRKNGIFTPKDIFGIEKNNALADNYLVRNKKILEQLPDSPYKSELLHLLEKI